MNQIDWKTGAQIIYLSHGGGPLPVLGEASHQAMIDFMHKLPSCIRRPEQILVISAHWEEAVATVTGAAAPPMLYDYYGFPDTAYSITYPAPGAPALAKRIAGLLQESDIPVQIDSGRGFDHGLFIPLRLIYPEADIPCLQLSLVQGLDPAAHIAIGNALRGLMNENILVIGSGFSFHNMGAFSWQGTAEADPENEAFQAWLIDSCTGSSTKEMREQVLINWEKAPFARYCHPREEHLLPLHVCLAMAAKPASLIFNDYILGKRSVAFLW